MTFELYFALATFALVTVITPGPNNLMLMASGANFGYRRSFPHITGVILGFPMMILPVGLGVMQVFELVPFARTVLTVLSVLYMLWLAWKIANAAPPKEAKAEGTPLTFLQAAAFQWVNPKAWSMALGAITLYAASRDIWSILIVSGTYVMVGVISANMWTVLGQQVRRVLTSRTRLRVFNIAMALLLIAALIPVVLPSSML